MRPLARLQRGNMTLGPGLVVRLSTRDWLAIAAILTTLATIAGGAYLRQDRMLSELMAISRLQQDRIARLESQMDAYLNRRPNQ